MSYREYDQETGYLFPPYIEDFISKDHVARAINKVVDKLDITEFTAEEKSEGRKAYHPRMMLKVLIYGYSQKAFSSRMIDKECCEDVVYMWLSGMQRPDFRTISNFRKNNIEKIKKLFKQVVLICKEVGIAKLGLVAIDGTKVKAVASDYKAKTENGLKEALKSIEEDIEKYLRDGITIDEAEDVVCGRERRGDELPEEVVKLISKKEVLESAIEKVRLIKEGDKTKRRDPKINPIEEEARFMKHSGGRIQLSYNSQIAVDEENGIIIGANLTDEANDKKQMVAMLKEIEETTGTKPEKAIFDAGYHSRDNLEDTKDSGIDCYVTSKKWEEEIKEGKNTRDVISKESVEVKTRDVKAVANPILTNTNNLTEDSKESGDKIDVVEEMAKKLQTEEGRDIYRRRKWIVEPVFGQVKYNLGFNRFRLKGIKKAGGEWLLICLAHNIKKINSWLLDKREKVKVGVSKRIKNYNLGMEVGRELVYCSI